MRMLVPHALASHVIRAWMTRTAQALHCMHSNWKHVHRNSMMELLGDRRHSRQNCERVRVRWSKRGAQVDDVHAIRQRLHIKSRCTQCFASFFAQQSELCSRDVHAAMLTAATWTRRMRSWTGLAPGQQPPGERSRERSHHSPRRDMRLRSRR